MWGTDPVAVVTLGVFVVGALVKTARRRLRINDLWIAAIAASRRLPVVTQDDDFDALGGAASVAVIRV
jgi:predicted nucleic acid-binding protein